MMRRLLRVLRFNLAILIACTVTGCHGPLGRPYPAEELRQSGAFTLLDPVDSPEVEGPSGCGAQALAAAIARLKPGVDARDLAAELPWHDLGATPVDLILEARRRGLSATLLRGDLARLRQAVRDEESAIVMIDVAPQPRTILGRVDPANLMHWALVLGVARDESAIALVATEYRAHLVDRKEFERRWDASDRCLIIIQYPPSKEGEHEASTPVRVREDAVHS
ncbi:MAG: hypothetical protein ACF8PN_02045 [Phycisphaerales bacterium]